MAKKELTYQQKIGALKKIHQRSDPDAKKTIEKWGDELERLNMEAEWLGMPDTIRLRETLEAQLDRIVSTLANDRTLTEARREALFEVKEVIYMLLAVVTADPSEDIQVVQEKIDSELAAEEDL